MIVYSYLSETNEYVGAEIANESPLEKGVYLIPAKSTIIEPPTLQDNEVAVFDGVVNEWTIHPDFRGTEYWLDDELLTMKEIGKLPIGYSLDKTLSVLKKEKLLELYVFIGETARQGIEELGVNSSLDKVMLGYVSSIAFLNNEENVIHDSQDIYHSGLSNADVVQILQATLKAYNALIEYKKSKELEIAPASDQTELDVIVIGTDFSL